MIPTVSIIIPMYNVEKCIRKCLNSVCQQTFLDLEILCIDDGSTDNSAGIIEELAAYDRRIVLKKNDENLGAGETRNKGITLAKGKYFFFLDADDFLETDAIEKMYQCAEKYNLQLCFCSHINYIETNKSLQRSRQTTYVFLKRYQGKVFSWNAVQRFLYQNIFCVPWNRLYRTDFVRDSSVRFPNLRNSEDFFFGEAIVTLAERMGVVDSEAPLIYYRLGRNGQVSSTIAQNPYCMLESVWLLYEFLRNNHKLNGMEKSYHSTVLGMLLFSISASKNPEQIIKHTVEQGFPKIGMDNLQCDDFTNAADYKQYRELLEGRRTYFNSYMVSLTEDKKKIDKIKQFLNQHKEEKTALWGMGKRGQALLHELGNTNKRFDYYIDVNPSKINETMNESIVCRYEDINEQVDYIMITNTNYFEDIYLQCKKNNHSCKIIDLDTFFRCDMTIEECMA